MSPAPAPSAAVERPGVPAPAAHGLLGPLGALAAGALAAAAVLAARAAGHVSGVFGLVLLLVLLVAVPTARMLSRRLVLTGGIAVGVVPALYLVRLPWPGPAGIVMVGLVGGLVAHVLWRGPGAAAARARALVPRARPIDALPALAALGAAGMLGPWLRVSDGTHALAALLPGWDNSAHYDMTAMIREHGVSVDRLAGGAIPWKFADYPQGHHAFVATLMDAVAPVRGTPSSELVLYVHAQAWSLVASITILAAALCALGWLRPRPLVALPVVSLAVVPLVAGPGGAAFANGFVNFVPAVALVACVPLVARELGHGLTPAPLAALTGLLVAVAHDWVLLLAIGLPAALLAVPQLVRAVRVATPRRIVAAVAILAAGAGGALHVVVVLHTLSPGDMLSIPTSTPDAATKGLIAVILGAIAVSLAAQGRTARFAVAPASGLLVVAALGAFEVISGSGPAYYAWKYFRGLGLASAVVLAAAAGQMVVRLPRPTRVTGWIASMMVAVAAPLLVGIPGDAARTFAVDESRTDASAQIIAAAERADRDPAADWSMLLNPPTLRNPMNAQQWLLALTLHWTGPANDAASHLKSLSTDGPAQVVRARLETDPAARFVVDPAALTSLRSALGEPLADRVVGW